MHARPAALALAVPLLARAVLTAAGAADPAPTAAAFPAKDSRYHDYAEMVATLQAAQTAHPDIVQMFIDRQELPGPRHLGGQDLRQRRRPTSPSPRSCSTALHHAREHLSARAGARHPALADDGLRHERRDHPASSTARDLDHPDGQPRRRRVRPRPAPVPRLAQEPPAERRLDRGRHGRQPQLRLPLGLLRRLVGLEVVVDLSRLDGVLDAGDAGHPRLHGAAAGSDGIQQIKAAITFHTAGEQILWPYGYTRTDVPGDMTAADHAALVAIGRQMAATNGYTAMQSSSLYVTDGDEIDWAYGDQRIWMYTFELYPVAQQGQQQRPVLPARRADRPRDRRGTRPRSCTSSSTPAACTRSPGMTKQNCGPLFDDFETRHGLGRQPARHRHRHRPPRARGARQPVGDRPAVGHGRRPARGDGDRPARRVERELVRPRRRHQRALGADRHPGDARRAHVPLLPRAQRELVVGRLLPGVRRARGRLADARPPGARRRERSTSRPGPRSASP